MEVYLAMNKKNKCDKTMRGEKIAVCLKVNFLQHSAIIESLKIKYVV